MKRVAFLGGGLAIFAALPSTAKGLSLRAKIEKIATDMPGALGVCARTLADGPPLAAYRAHEIFPTASIIKVLIMTTAFVFEEQRPGVLQERVTFHDSDLIAGSDFMQSASDGEKFTVAQLLRPMIQVSDNTAANLLIGHFGVQAIDEVGAWAGMQSTWLNRKFLDWNAIVRHEDNVTTPYDMAQLLSLIERGAHEGTKTILTPHHCRQAIDLMLGQTDRDAIPAALPPGISAANKTGEIDGTRNDVAIVEPYGEDPLILAIMTKAAYDYGASYAAIHAVTRAVWHATH